MADETSLAKSAFAFWKVIPNDTRSTPPPTARRRSVKIDRATIPQLKITSSDNHTPTQARSI